MKHRLALLPLLGLLAACQSPPAVPSACAWERVIHPDPGFEARFTRSEKQQILEHNNDVRAFCPPQP